MAQSFAWKDLLSLPRYRNQQQYLDNALRLLYAPGLVSSVLSSMIAPTSRFYTTIQHPGNSNFPNLLGQLYHPADQSTARLAFLAPKSAAENPGFARLLAHLSKKAGERGAFQILAEVPQGEGWEDTLYQAGFRPYAEQRIWKLSLLKRAFPADRSWCPVSDEDEDPLVSLYQRVTPHRVLRVEPPPKCSQRSGLVRLSGDQRLLCGLTQYGPRGILVDFVLDPALGDLEEQLMGLFNSLSRRGAREVYLRTRSYQGNLAFALESLGAQAGELQTAVVKKLTLKYNAKQAYSYQAFEKQPDITTPISNSTVKK